MALRKPPRPREGCAASPEIVINDPEITHPLEEMAKQAGTSVQQITAHLLRCALSAYRTAQDQFHWRDRLSPREQQVIALLCLGYTYREIAGQLVVSYETVKTHARNAFRKLGLRNLSEMRQTLGHRDVGREQLLQDAQCGNPEAPP